MSAHHVTRTKILIGERTAPLVARVNRRAKRLILKVDSVAGEIHVTAPSKRALPEAIAFARERSDWIASQLDDKLKGRPFAEGMTFPYRGVLHKVVLDGGARAPVRVKTGLFPLVKVGGDPAHINRRVTDWLKREARKTLIERADYYCYRLNKRRNSIQVRDMRTRWGSCSSDGALSFSWRLILTPPEILDYVVAHECVHLIHMDHSPAFWRVVAKLGVDAREAADWFDANGSRLFSYGVRSSADVY